MMPTTEERFWSHVNKTDSCWLWTGSKREKGYGAFVWSEDGLVVQGRAHRYAWQLEHGRITDGMCCLHKCDTPACVRPDHLWLGTRAENNMDMCMKGRHVTGGTRCGLAGRWPRGSSHHNAKATPEIVQSIRQDRSAGMSFGNLALKYRMSLSGVRKIALGLTWKLEEKEVEGS
jgi:hypothetical protein